MHITRLNSSWIEKMSNLAISVFDKQESVYYQDKKFYDGIVSFLNNCSIKNMLIQFLNNKMTLRDVEDSPFLYIPALHIASMNSILFV